MPESREEPRRQAGGELIIPVAAVVFTLYFFSTILNSPWTAQVNAFLIGGVLIALCLIFIVKTALRVRSGTATLGLGNLIQREDLSSGRAGLFLLTLGYAIAIDWGGFTLTTFLFLMAAMALLTRGRRLGLITAVSAIMALGGWALFIWAFDTRFPRGWFETTMKAVLDNG
ncbi:MAG TPA: tripartite tricarboxylate transporter TctB family protein [Thermohalobaculum sp.]|nr:tripartite tricarboxylate transporter TctB family protein [Thermohalobaculum sp.]